MDYILLSVIVIESFLLLVCTFKRYDGRIEIDEARDSWTVAITENPEKIKRKRYIRLKVKNKNCIDKDMYDL